MCEFQVGLYLGVGMGLVLEYRCFFSVVILFFCLFVLECDIYFSWVLESAVIKSGMEDLRDSMRGRQLWVQSL